MPKKSAVDQSKIMSGDEQAGTMSPGRARFLKLLKEDILKLDLAELDFGIYRILNYRRAEIESFFDEKLPTMLEEAISREGDVRLKDLEVRIAALRTELDDVAKVLGLNQAFVGKDLEEKLKDTPKGAQYLSGLEEKDALEAAEGFAPTEEERLYNALYTFFSRYYRDGDFEPQPRRGKDAKYSVAYNGEDVHFHWRSRGSHYIKTAEELKSYSFKVGRWKVDFEVIDAYQEPDNSKGTTRYFLPIAAACRTEGMTEEGARFIVPFAFRPLSAQEAKRYETGRSEGEVDGTSVQERVLNDLVDSIEPPTGISKLDILKNSQRYARKNRSDYFVHPHLGNFLRTELDYFLKNEFLVIESITSPETLSDQLLKSRVLREIAFHVIELLDQIESFQAMLFEKKKFVLEVRYLIAVRLIPTDLHPIVMANPDQMTHWSADIGVEKIDDLQRFPSLMVDTRYFAERDREALIGCLMDLDDATDGILVHGENYGGLRTLSALIQGRVNLTYIDPPYNTGNDGFLYKDEFSRHSTWLTMMEERLRLAHVLLPGNGVLVTHIDENEMERLRVALEMIYGDPNALGTMVWDKGNPKGDPLGIASQHEYLLFWGKDKQTLRGESDFLMRRKKNALVILAKAATFCRTGGTKGESLDEINAQFRAWIKGQESFSGGEKAYNRIDQDGRVFQSVSMGWPNMNRAPDEYFIPLIHPETGRPCAIPDRGWRNPPATMAEILERNEILFGLDHSTIPRRKYFLDENLKENLPSLLRYGGSDGDLLKNMGVPYGDPSLKPLAVAAQIVEAAGKPHGVVLDFFAGSGTTGHACVALNRELGGRRKFVLIELGDYFEGSLLKRIERTASAPSWRDGKPETALEFDPTGWDEWINRSPRVLKVLRLESYEDTLQSLELASPPSPRADRQMQIHGEDYVLRYMLPIESEGTQPLLSTVNLQHPFDYALTVKSHDGARTQRVDLIETFNLLMGFRVQRIQSTLLGERPYLFVEATDNGQPVLVVWRSVEGLDPAEERVSLMQEYNLSKYERIYVNADSALPNAISLDAEFKRRMFERAPSA